MIRHIISPTFFYVVCVRGRVDTLSPRVQFSVLKDARASSNNSLSDLSFYVNCHDMTLLRFCVIVLTRQTLNT